MSAKTVFVTGAGRGIGRAIALRLARDGYVVRGCARSAAELEETKALSGGSIRASVVDVSDEAGLERWLSSGYEDRGAEPWGLVTAAGVLGPVGPFLENSWQDWRRAIEINLFGTVLAVGAFARELVRRGKPGRIVLLSGGGATQPLPNLTSYCASKAGLVRFGETMSHELKPFGITVNAIAPGAVNTRFTEELLSAGPARAGSEFHAKLVAQKGSGGVPPERAADLAAYLLGPDACAITGRLISAVWDKWEGLHGHKAILDNAEVYTLRRVVPKVDRE